METEGIDAKLSMLTGMLPVQNIVDEINVKLNIFKEECSGVVKEIQEFKKWNGKNKEPSERTSEFRMGIEKQKYCDFWI